MNPISLNRLHTLRLENAAKGYAMADMRPRFERMADRHTNGTAPQAIAVHQLFQTPPRLAADLVALLDLQPGSRVLEPSAGLGRILDALTPFQPSEIVAVETAAPCAAELFKREGITLKQRDFLTVQPEEIGTFDAVAMNPPFTMRADIRHILHALKFLRTGGTLGALCLDTPHREKSLRHMATTWQQVPAGAFKKEGTNVSTVLLTIKS